MTSIKQDMPPINGYPPIPFYRNPAKSYFNGYQMFAGSIAITIIGLCIYYKTAKEIKMQNIEIRSARFAIHPILLAERDRSYLKQLRRNRDEETDLMKNIQDWKVGTWYGERIFKTIPAEHLVDPQFKEFYINTTFKSFADRALLSLYT